MRKIVVGYDGSNHSKRALDRAAEIADDDVEIVVLCAARVPRETTDPVLGVETGDLGQLERLQDTLDDAKELLAQRGRAARTVQGYGDPAESLVTRAGDEKADLIVVGTRGLSTVQRALLGSVSTKVVHHAPCDVLVVR
jgi:nucleotide-binding universal stress UspA family protein